ncbi:MAG: phenylalanine--tRNA ligase beta subunit-related protein [Bacteroidota bacterium]
MLLPKIKTDIGTICPELRLGCISSRVVVEAGSAELWCYIESVIQAEREGLSTSEIGQIPTIRSTRAAYKALGKEPSRYRPSAEALLRKIAQGKDLYQVNNVVDLLNLTSIRTGFSICGYDQDAIEGAYELGIGEVDEPYQAIGRGTLNIAYLPCFRDQVGAFGTPTSDSVRTSVRPHTKRFLMILLSFAAGEALEAAMNDAISLLQKYASATEIESQVLAS